jgi:Sec-independent protein translocase protein TatA
VFEGLFSPWHLVILVAVVFVVVGPRRIARHWHDSTERLGQIGNGPDPERTEASGAEDRTRSSPAYRLGRLLRRRS